MVYTIRPSTKPGKNGLKPLLLSTEKSILSPPTSPDLEAQRPEEREIHLSRRFKIFISTKILRKQDQQPQPEATPPWPQEEKRKSVLKELKLPVIVKRKSTGSYSDFSPPPSPLRNQFRPVSLYESPAEADIPVKSGKGTWNKIKSYICSCWGMKRNLATLSDGDMA